MGLIFLSCKQSLRLSTWRAGKRCRWHSVAEAKLCCCYNYMLHYAHDGALLVTAFTLVTLEESLFVGLHVSADTEDQTNVC